MEALRCVVACVGTLRGCPRPKMHIYPCLLTRCGAFLNKTPYSEQCVTPTHRHSNYNCNCDNTVATCTDTLAAKVGTGLRLPRPPAPLGFLWPLPQKPKL